jgi:hypothetical protein
MQAPEITAPVESDAALAPCYKCGTPIVYYHSFRDRDEFAYCVHCTRESDVFGWEKRTASGALVEPGESHIIDADDGRDMLRVHAHCEACRMPVTYHDVTADLAEECHKCGTLRCIACWCAHEDLDASDPLWLCLACMPPPRCPRCHAGLREREPPSGVWECPSCFRGVEAEMDVCTF